MRIPPRCPASVMSAHKPVAILLLSVIITLAAVMPAQGTTMIATGLSYPVTNAMLTPTGIPTAILIKPTATSTRTPIGPPAVVPITPTDGPGVSALSISISDRTAAFGTNLSPAGTNSNSSDQVVDFQGNTGNQGSYYVWKAGGSGTNGTGYSSKTWNGTIWASENTGTSASMTIASGVLRCSSSAPASYNEAANGAAFTTDPDVWQTNHPKGTSYFTFYYSLRVDWDDDPGTFASTVTYFVTQ